MLENVGFSAVSVLATSTWCSHPESARSARAASNVIAIQLNPPMCPNLFSILYPFMIWSSSEIEYAIDVESQAHSAVANIQIAAAHILVGRCSDGIGHEDLEVVSSQRDIQPRRPTVELVRVAHRGCGNVAGDDRRHFGEQGEE